MRNRLRNSIVITGIATTCAVTLPSPAGAETFSCGNEDVACLISAINEANGDTQEKSTIWLELGGTYTLTSVDNDTDGPNGLPSITGELTIRVKGKGTATLTRATDANTPFFRLLRVAATGHLTLWNLVVSNGRTTPSQVSGDGGGVLNDGGEVTLHRTTLSGNVAAASGGGLASSGVATIKQSFFIGNSAHTDGAISNSGSMTILDSTVDRNSGFGAGGLLNSGTMTIFRSRITDNSSAFQAGGLYVLGGSVLISETTFAGNVSQGAGALFVAPLLIGDRARVVVTESAFDENRAFQSAAVGVLGGGARLEVINTTFSRNTVPVVTNAAGVLVLTNTTFAENTGPNGFPVPSILSSSGAATTILQNTILAHDADDGVTRDCSGTVTSNGNNVFGDPTGCNVTLQPGDLTGDAGLDLFTDGGKPGHVYFTLLPTSPAIGAGNADFCPIEDQLDRPRKGRCDIGAINFHRHERHENTIISVTSPPSLSTGISSSTVVSRSWSQSKRYTGVSIAVLVDSLQVGLTPTANAYLTTRIGPGTTPTDEIAHVQFMVPADLPICSLSSCGAEVTLFSGLSLGPGAYFLTIAPTPISSSAVGWFPTGPGPQTVSLGTGVSKGASFITHGSGAVASYPPASAFDPYLIGISPLPVPVDAAMSITVTGTVELR